MGGVKEIGAPTQLSATPLHWSAERSTIPLDGSACSAFGAASGSDVWQQAGVAASQHGFAGFAWQQQHWAAGASSANSCDAASTSTYSGGVTLFSRAQASFSAIDMQQQSRQHCSAEWQPQR